MTGPTVESSEDDVPPVAGPGDDVDEAAIHAVGAHYDAIFTWDYEKASRPGLNRLYEKAKVSMWNGETDLAWDTPIDQEAVVIAEDPYLAGHLPRPDMAGTPFANWGRREWLTLGMESQNWTLSQFMHGEQGALVCAARIVETVPWVDAKFYAATQVMDEARHLEVFSRYLDTKLSGHYPVNPHLLALLDDIITDSRWDIAYLGMQIMVEGLALAAFGMIRETTVEPLLKQILSYVMADEARHVAFGITSLKGFYQQLSAPEIRDRQEFALDAAIRMRDRLLQEEVWERLGVPAAQVRDLMLQSHDQQTFRQLLFCKIVPNCRKLGLLDAADGWLRKRFTELGVIKFEEWSDSDDEIGMLRLADGGIPAP